MQGVIRGAIGNEDASALGERNVFRKAMNLRFEGEGVFGVGAGNAFGDVHAVAGFYFCDAVANRFDYTGAVAAGSVGKLRKDGVIAGAGIGVGGIDASSMDLDQDLSGSGFEGGDFFEFEDFWAAEGAD